MFMIIRKITLVDQQKPLVLITENCHCEFIPDCVRLFGTVSSKENETELFSILNILTYSTNGKSPNSFEYNFNFRLTENNPK